jgi:hypothetical protein
MVRSVEASSTRNCPGAGLGRRSTGHAITSGAANGTVCVYNSAAAHIVLDVEGSATT